MFIVGTAGHVDHGKSSLIHALTGKHPDRLKEEQTRGMTIDLGYAWTEIADTVISFVDVPGHSDFLNNMLVGISEVQGTLLVVDANAGIMPQTIEHAHILSLLGIQQGVIALTKVDLIDDAAWLEWIEHDIRNLLQQAGLPPFPIIHSSVVTGRGLDDLKTHLLNMAQRFAPADGMTHLRLPIDRVFHLKGYGTVVTGTLHGEPLAVGAEVLIAPSGLPARIRQLQSHNQVISVGQVGDRLAVNLSNVDTDQIHRGDVLIRPQTIQPTLLCDVYYQQLAHVTRPLKHGEQVRLFVGTSKVIATIHAPHLGIIPTGQSACLQLNLRDEAVMLRGDRFVIRLLSPSETVGGGIILDPLPSFRYRKQNIVAWQKLEDVALGTDQEWLQHVLSHADDFSFFSLTMRTNLPARYLTHLLTQLTETHHVQQLGKDRYVSTARVQEVAQRITSTVKTFLHENPHYFGMKPHVLMSMLNIDMEMLMVAIHQASHDLIQTPEGWVTLAKHQVRISDELQHRTAQALAWLDQQPFSPPDLPSLIGMGLTQPTLDYLTHSRAVVFIHSNLILSHTAYNALLERIHQLATTHPTFSVADVRDHLQTSRKYALAYLEYLDRMGITTRNGDERRLKRPNQAD